MTESGVQDRRAWLILAISTAAQLASSVIVASGAFLIPALSDPNGEYRLTLAAAGTVAAMTTAGLMLTLVLWGLLVDRAGERITLMIGLSAGAAAMAGPLLYQLIRGEGIETSGPVALAGILLAGGMAAGSANAASGRLVIGWFPVHRRGTAMGIRQMAQPLGVATAAVSIPTVAAQFGVAAALAIPAALTLLAAAATALWVTDPQRPSRTSPHFSELRKHPYARHTGLLRIHASAVLLVIPQFTIWSFALVWLMTEREWSAFTAGLLVGAIQLAGAGGRVAAGAWSDRAHPDHRCHRRRHDGCARTDRSAWHVDCHRAPRSRRRHHGRRQRCRVHSGSRDCRAILGRSGTQRPQHGPERRRCRCTARFRCHDHRRRFSRHIRVCSRLRADRGARGAALYRLTHVSIPESHKKRDRLRGSFL
ncbi:MFS transporter [Hoyosella altamirensis]|uniref:MFS family permease n=1 Tax=Hoyosella altamirensis TaxID=616997 RepID=A0A839RJ18_9ACTN|nr:MFS family permease [Hoyosella altamirensis]